ncbi:MAG: hypothetical protein ABI867_11890 [Kofleriaceae bacterium]
MPRWILLVMLGCAEPSPPSPAPPVQLAPAPAPARVTAVVCVHCTGPLAVDREGHAIASVELTIDAIAPLREVRLADLVLTDAQGVIAHGVAAPNPGRTLAAGDHVVMWTGATLDILDPALAKRHPTHYRLRVIAAGNVSLDVAGAVPPLGPTG